MFSHLKGISWYGGKQKEPWNSPHLWLYSFKYYLSQDYVGSSLRMRGKGKYLRWRGDKAMNTRRGGSSPGLDMGQRLACPHPCPTSYNTLGREQYLLHAKSLPSCRTLCDPKDCSPPGSSVHGILQARILEWVAMPSSTGSRWPRDRTRVSCSSCIAGRFFFTTEPPGKPTTVLERDIISCGHLSCGPGLPISQVPLIQAPHNSNQTTCL